MNILKSLKEAILSAHFISVDLLISRSFPLCIVSIQIYFLACGKKLVWFNEYLSKKTAEVFWT